MAVSCFVLTICVYVAKAVSLVLLSSDLASQNFRVPSASHGLLFFTLAPSVCVYICVSVCVFNICLMLLYSYQREMPENASSKTQRRKRKKKHPVVPTRMLEMAVCQCEKALACKAHEDLDAPANVSNTTCFFILAVLFIACWERGGVLYQHVRLVLPSTRWLGAGQTKLCQQKM